MALLLACFTGVTAHAANSNATHKKPARGNASHATSSHVTSSHVNARNGALRNGVLRARALPNGSSPNAASRRADAPVHYRTSTPNNVRRPVSTAAEARLKLVSTKSGDYARANVKSSAKSPAAKSVPVKSSSGTRASRKRSAKRKSREPRGQMAPTASRISEIQSALADQGAFQGEPNGRWDDATTAAMRNFQSSHGLNPTGKLDALTLQKLGLGSDVAGRGAPLPRQSDIQLPVQSLPQPEASAVQTSSQQGSNQ